LSTNARTQPDPTRPGAARLKPDGTLTAMVVYVALVLFVIGWGAHLAWRWKQAKDFAPELLKARQETGELPPSIDEAEFTDLYLRAEGPRAATYVFACAAFMTFALAPLTALFNLLWDQFWRLSGGSPVFEQGTLIHTFSLFLGLTGIAVGLLALAMRRYYVLMPPNLKQVFRTLKDSHS
jgi:hypothetical protein